MFIHQLQMSLPAAIPLSEKQEINKILGMRRIPVYIMSILCLLKENFKELEKFKDFGTIYLSHFGAADSTAQYLYNLLDFPADQATPSLFSNSVFNAPAAYISKFFHSHGPTLSANGFNQEIFSVIQTAYTWLQTGFCPYVLMVLADENCAFTQIIKPHCRTDLFIPAQIITMSREKFTNSTEIFSAEELINNTERNILKNENRQ